MDSVSLDLEMVDAMIRYWRGKREKAESQREELIASCHIEAHQLMRIIHGFPLLPEEDKSSPDRPAEKMQH